MPREDFKPGWWFPLNSRKAHYMVDDFTIRSLCGKWGALTYTIPTEDYNHDSGDNCATCKKKLVKLQEKKAGEVKCQKTV